MSSENLHTPRERLSRETLNLHFAIVSLMEEVDGIESGPGREAASVTAIGAFRRALLGYFQ